VKRILLERPQRQHQAVVTVGSFDGLHIGHRAVVDRVKEIAGLRDGTSIVVTFDPHPRQVIVPDSAPKLLTSLAEKSAVLGRAGVDLLAVVPFTKDLRKLGAEAFVDRYLVDFLSAETVVVGYDHGFGRDRAGNLDTIQGIAKKRGFDVVAVPPTLLDGEPASSTRVRAHIEAGELDEAVRILGSGYPILGSVEEGDRRGRTIGFPTANLALPSSKLLPPDGVYAGWVQEEARAYMAVANLGTRPTFNGTDRKFEVHLLDYEGDLYGRDVEIAINTRLRAEQKFDGLEVMKSQINKDIVEARRRLEQTSISMDAHNSTDGG
jgi:riboflavin kinase/FMN adenylyltransferase